MPTLPFRLEIADVMLDHGGHLLLPLFYPEISAVGRKVERLTDEVRRGVAWVIEREAAVAIYRRRPAGTPQVREIRVTLDAPRESACWRQPVELTLHALVWSHGASATLAYVPMLDVEAAAEDEERLQAILPAHIRFALMRAKATASLRPLVWLSRAAEVGVLTVPAEIEVRTPRERAAEDDDRRPSTLRAVTSELARLAPGPVFERDALIRRVAEALTGRRPRSVLLVGPSGVGKTAIVVEMARRRARLGLGHTPLRATTGARLVSGMTGYGMWQERCQKLCQEAAKQKAIVHFGNLVELAEVGKHEGNQLGVASFLRPYFERGDVLAICECTPEQLARLERHAPNLLDAFLQIRVEEPTREQCKNILRQYAAQGLGNRMCASRSAFATAPHEAAAPLSDDALDAVERLHRRYATYSATPGRPLRFLHNLLEDAAHRRQAPSTGQAATLDAAAVTAAFSAETGLPLELLDESRRLDLRAAHDWFAARVLGQTEAVALIVDLLAAVKADLTRPQRPIASLLFIGPTGVGKTEMAKALAEFLYRDARRMTRIDMSEYADPLAADRLIGGAYSKEGLLTARLREQPFGVVLLDEFEKAHPRVFDMLLQVLGEGRLTDAAGRLADFSNAVVILTSNLGAEDHQRAALGFGDAAQAADRVRDHYLRAVRQFLRPELFNRIDRVVPFIPLDESLLQRIARRELDLLAKRDGVRFRAVRLRLTDRLAAYLTHRGYHPRYGARPLKRALERELLAPLADALNQFSHDTPVAAEIEVGDERLSVKARGRGQHASPAPNFPETSPRGLHDLRIAEVARRCVSLRRDAFRLQQSHAVLDIENTIYRLTPIEKKLLRGKTVSVEEQQQLRRLAGLRKMRERVVRLTDGAVALEEQILLPCYQRQDADLPACIREADLLDGELSQLALDLYGLNFGASDLVALVVYGETPVWLFSLAAAYHRMAKARGLDVHLIALRALTETTYQRLAAGDPQPLPTDEFLLGIPPGTDRTKLKSADVTALRGALVSDADVFLDKPQEGVIGLAFRIAGPLALPLFEPENGLHVVRQDGERYACLVHTAGQDIGPLFEYYPPPRIDRRGAIGKQPLRRQYDLDREEIDDRWLDEKYRTNQNLDETLAALTTRRLETEARRWLGLS